MKNHQDNIDILEHNCCNVKPYMETLKIYCDTCLYNLYVNEECKCYVKKIKKYRCIICNEIENEINNIMTKILEITEEIRRKNYTNIHILSVLIIRKKRLENELNLKVINRINMIENYN